MCLCVCQILEAQLHLAHVTNCTTQFYHAIAALPPEVINTLSPAPLDAKNFQIPKSAVLSEHKKTKPELFEKLIAATTMCGRPSTYGREVGDRRRARAPQISAGITDLDHSCGRESEISLAQIGTLADEL